MNIRAECTCGQAYAFDVEPVNGQMPCAVACPGCGADGTQLANQFIRSSLEQAETAPVPVPPSPAPGLRINRPPVQPPNPLVESDVAPPAPPAPSFPRARYEAPLPPLKPAASVPRGVIGGIVAGGISMVGWYLLTISTGIEFGFVAWFVGIATGLGVRMMARDGSPGLAYIAALCSGIAILGGEFLVVNHIVDRIIDQYQAERAETYTDMINEAKEGVKAQSDDEVTAWLKNKDNFTGNVTAQDITNFRNDRQAKMRDLLNGKPASDEFVRGPKIGFSVRFAIFKSSVGLFSALWVILGVGSAWRIASA